MLHLDYCSILYIKLSLDCCNRAKRWNNYLNNTQKFILSTAGVASRRYIIDFGYFCYYHDTPMQKQPSYNRLNSHEQAVRFAQIVSTISVAKSESTHNEEQVRHWLGSERSVQYHIFLVMIKLPSSINLHILRIISQN